MWLQSMKKSVKHKSILENVSRVAKPQLSDLIINQLQDLILQGKMVPGTRLPNERELATKFGVSRVTLREALKALALSGWIDMRPGDGNYVAEFSPDKMVKPLSYMLYLSKENILDLHEIRLILEVETTGLAAKRCSNEQLQEIRTLLKGMEENAEKDHNVFMQYDAQFHTLVCNAANNPALARLTEFIFQILHEALKNILILPEGRRKAIEDHRQIFQAFMNHDLDQAREAAKNHLTHVKEFLLIEEEVSPRIKHI